jgi:hypothetical protein
MSAVSPASSQVRRSAGAPPARSAPLPHAAQAGRGARVAFDPPDPEDEIRIRLDDIPPLQQTMDVEGFKPTLLSRLFDLVTPHKR